MKIQPKAADAYVARPDKAHRAMLLYGPDAGLARARARTLVEALLGKGYDTFALTELTEAKLLSDPALLSDELSAIGLLASRRVILVRDADDKLAKIIADALAQPRPEVWLIACAGELSPRSALRAFFEKESSCAAIACYHDEARDVQAVMRQAFDAAGVRCEREAIDYLAQQLGNDRGVTEREIEKLIVYAGEEKQLTLEDARLLTDYNRETDFDGIASALADRDVKSLEKTLALALREGQSPIGWLRAGMRYFNRLYLLRARMAEGISAEQAVQALRPPVFFRQVPILTRHLQQWTAPQIAKALKLLASAELAAKSSDIPVIPATSRRLMQVTQVR